MASKTVPKSIKIDEKINQNFDTISHRFFYRFFVDFGSQNRSKIAEKSIGKPMEQQKSEKTKILILPRILQCFRAFGHLMLKSFFKKNDQKTHQKINQKINVFVDRFGIHFSSILGGFWKPRWLENPSKID